MAALGFFRKNTKMVVWIMVILMGVFLLSAVGARQLTNLFVPKGDNRVIGSVGAEKIRRGDIGSAKQDIDILLRLGVGDVQRVVTRRLRPGEEGFLRFVVMAGNQEVQRSIAWALLVREARSMGLKADEALVNRFVTEALRLDKAGYNKLLGRLRKEGVYQDALERAIGNFLLVSMAFESVAAGAEPSEQNLRRLYRDINSRMDVAMLTFGAGEYLKDVPDKPAGDDPDAVLAKMWDELKEFRPGDINSPHPLKFGYRRPARIKLEYAYIDWNDVADQIEVTEEEIYDFWEANPDQFKDAAAQEGEEAKEPEQRRYASDKSKARTMVRNVRAAARLKKLSAKLHKAASLGETKSDPDASTSPLAQAVEGMSGEIDIRYLESPEWIGPAEFQADPLLRSSVSQRQSLGELAFSVKEVLGEEFAGQAKAETGKLFGRVMTVVNVVNGQLDQRQPTRGALLWRVTAAEDAAAPTVFDEKMRKRVYDDWRVEQSYDIAMAKAEKARVRVTEVGMADVAKELDKTIEEAVGLSRQMLMMGFRPNPSESIQQQSIRFMLTRPYMAIPGVGGLGLAVSRQDATRFIESVFEMAPEVAEASERATTTPAPADTVKVIGLPQSGMIVLAARTKYTPAYEQDFVGEDGVARQRLLSSLRMNSRFDAVVKWFSIQEIKDRAGFTPIAAEE